MGRSMKDELKKTTSAKFVAIGFIAMVLLGNYWFTMSILGKDIPPIFYNLIELVTAWTIISGACLLLAAYKINQEQNNGPY